MRASGRLGATLATVIAAAISMAAPRAEVVQLIASFYPSGRRFEVSLRPTYRTPPHAKIRASVEIKDGQARIEFDFARMEPALLFGGDVTAWVVWAITADGVIDNLGELPVRENREGETSFSTPHNNFALMVTAESSPLARRPSDLVAYASEPSASRHVQSAPFTFDGLHASVRRDVESIADLRYGDSTPVSLQQARRTVDLMDRAGAERFAPQAANDARAALGQADDAYHGRSGKRRDVADLCSRAIVLASEAMRETERKIDAQSAADVEAKRQAELSALGHQAANAEQARLDSEAALAEVDKERRRLEAEKALLMAEHERLLKEREDLVQRVATVLGAGTWAEPTSEGVVVTLPGSILFDRGASGLKPSARIMLAKLAGVLLVTSGATLRIEGHSDASGTHAANLRLSEERARSVMAFLESEGVSPTRMTAIGLGSTHPIAPSDTPENRAKNRRVEIVLSH